MRELTPAAAEPTAARIVVFDVGNVLIDWDPRYLYRQLLPDERAVERFLAEVCTPQWNHAQDLGRPWAEAVAMLAARFPDQAELIAAFDTRWEETVAGAIEGSVALLAELRQRGVPRYALTNFAADKFALTRQRFDFLDWFDGIVVSADEGLAKPDPRIYRLLLERYRLPPAQTVYIDDRVVNVTAAQERGMTGLHFTGAAQLRADLVALGLLDGSGGGRVEDQLRSDHLRESPHIAQET